MFECRSVVQLKSSPFDIVFQPWDASDLTNMRLKSCNILWLMGIHFTNFPSILKLKLTRSRFLDHQPQMIHFDCINVHIHDSELDLVEAGPPAQHLQFPVSYVLEAHRSDEGISNVLSRADEDAAVDGEDDPVEKDEQDAVEAAHETRTAIVAAPTAETAAHLFLYPHILCIITGLQ